MASEFRESTGRKWELRYALRRGEGLPSAAYFTVTTPEFLNKMHET
jgi:hypothetical protein